MGERCSSDLQLHWDWFRLPHGHVQLQQLQQQYSKVIKLNHLHSTVTILPSGQKESDTEIIFFPHRDTLVISIINSLTSILAGFVIFSAFGYMSHLTNIEIDKLAVDGK